MWMSMQWQLGGHTDIDDTVHCGHSASRQFSLSIMAAHNSATKARESIRYIVPGNYGKFGSKVSFKWLLILLEE